MTEDEWLTTDDVQKLYWEVRPRDARYRRSSPLSIMTLRLGALFAVACVRHTPQAAARPFLPVAVQTVEQVAETGVWDDLATISAEAHVRNGKAFHTFGENSSEHYWGLVGVRLTENNIDGVAPHVPLFLLHAVGPEADSGALRKTYADLLRDIAGNPYRGGRGRQLNPKRRTKPQREPVFRPEWRTDTVQALARAMYESRDFTGMPILADALQDAGCEQPDILDHCRNVSLPHVRGCWVVDLVLGKS